MELPLPDELSRLLPDGEYIVENFLGQGGMGAVYQGLQMPLRRPVAIKILQRKRGGDDFHFEERFRREAYAMAELTHPNVVQVYDCGDAGEEFLFISMELVKGGDLSHAMRHGHLTLGMSLQMLVPICEGVQAAHEHGLVHRDIKPANIFLTMDSRPKVADFGLAKRFNTETTFVTQSGLGMGTPDYAAPEQYEDATDLDHRVDIYSLGVMFYQMLTGHLPRGAYKPASRLVEVDQRLDAVLQRAMQNDREERYQNVVQLKMDVQHILATWMAPPRPRVIMQTGRVPVGTGRIGPMTGRVPTVTSRVPTMTGRVPTMTGRVPTMTGRVSTMTGRVPTATGRVSPMTGRVPTVVRPMTPHATTTTHPTSAHTGLVAKRNNTAGVLAGLFTVLALGGAAFFVANRHASINAAAAVTTAARQPDAGTASSAGPGDSAWEQVPTSVNPLPPLPTRVALQTLNLLAVTDPVKDGVSKQTAVHKSEWVREGATLVYKTDGMAGKITAPVSLDAFDYEIELRAERRGGNGRIHLELPLGAGRILPLILNDPARKILNEKLGPGWPRNAAVMHASIRVVRHLGGKQDDRMIIRDVAGGMEILNWEGRLTSLGGAGEARPEFNDMPLLALFVPSDSYVVKTWKLTVYEGTTVNLRERGAQASLSSASFAGHAPGESTPATKTSDARLTKLESGFQQRREADAQKPFVTAMATLNAGYARALASARATAVKQGNASQVSLFDEESNRTKAGTPPPSADAPGTPESLVKLRTTYRAEMEKHVAARDKADAVLFDIYLVALDGYIEELARSNDEARSREVQEVRRQIAARKPQAR